MKPEEIEANKAAFLQACRRHIRREGLEKLLAYLETTDFYTAPSSASYHLNEDGGLCRHSLNVFETALHIYQSALRPRLLDGTAAFTEEIPAESIAITTLLHDLCKTKLYHKTEKWKKDEHGRWVTYPGYELLDDFPFGHGEKSCIIIGWFMKLRQEELLAIRWHMGMFDMGEQGSSSRYAFRAAMDKTPLVTLLQAADLLAANCMEKTTRYK